MPSRPTSPATESQAFAQRLRQALEEAGWPASPTVVAHQFNLRYWGRSISVHAARNWLLGVSLPRQDKLRVLAHWLHVPPEAPLLGARPAAYPIDAAATGLADQRMWQTYLRLSHESRRTVQTVVAACEALDAAPDTASAEAARARRRR
jgi:hypothetical protein